jgi:hypothetical protein
MEDLETLIRQSWYALLPHSLRLTIGHDTFMALIGVEPLVMEYIWIRLGNCRELPKRHVLLWVF